MVSAKLYAIYWLHKDNLYHTKKELKYNHIHFERTGGSGEDVELQVWVEVKGKGLKTFMKDLKNKIYLFQQYSLDVYSLIKNKQVLLNEEQDLDKMIDTLYLNDEEFIKCYSYFKSEKALDYIKVKSNMFNLIKGLGLI